MVGHLVPGDTVHDFLAEHSVRLFPDEMFADRVCPRLLDDWEWRRSRIRANTSSGGSSLDLPAERGTDRPRAQGRVIVTPKEKHKSVSPEPLRGGRECRFARDGGVGDRLKADRVSLTYPLPK